MSLSLLSAKGFALSISIVIALVLSGSCTPVPPAPEEFKGQGGDANFRSIALLPAQFTTSQPDSFCHSDIGDDLRRAFSRRLRSMGYSVQMIPDNSPNSFALDDATPDPGVTPRLLNEGLPSTDAALGIWVEHYMATGLCEGYGGGNTLEMSVTVVLYASPEGREVGRWGAQEWGVGGGRSQELVLRVLERLTDKLLAGLRRR